MDLLVSVCKYVCIAIAYTHIRDKMDQMYVVYAYVGWAERHRENWLQDSSYQ